MKDSKHTVDFREFGESSLYASFSSRDRELLKRALMFIYHSFPEHTDSCGSERNNSLTIRGPNGGFCTIHSYGSGELAASVDQGLGHYMLTDFTGADVSLQLQLDRLNVCMHRRGLPDTCFGWTIQLNGDFERIAASFREEFSK